MPPLREPQGKERDKEGEEQRRKQADGGNPAQPLAAENEENQPQFGEETVCEGLARGIIKGENALNVMERPQSGFFPSYLELPELPFIVTVKTGPGSGRGRLGPLIDRELGGPRPWPKERGGLWCGQFGPEARAPARPESREQEMAQQSWGSSVWASLQGAGG